jgi:hypothetical protein
MDGVRTSRFEFELLSWRNPETKRINFRPIRKERREKAAIAR